MEWCSSCGEYVIPAGCVCSECGCILDIDDEDNDDFRDE